MLPLLASAGAARTAVAQAPGGDRASAGAARRGAGGAGRASCTAGAGRATRAPASGQSYSRSRAGSPTCSPATGSCRRCWRSAWARRSSRSWRSRRSGGGRTTAAPACCRSRSARSRRRRCSPRAGRSARATSICRRSGWPGRRRRALASAGIAARVSIACVVVIVGGLQAAQRRADVVSYDRRVAAARRVVGSGLASGYRVFNIMSGVKDLDLAVKEDPRLADHAGDALVLTDVPASFVIVPAALAPAAAPLRRAAAAAAVGRLPVRRRAGGRAGAPGGRAVTTRGLAAFPRHPLRAAASGPQRPDHRPRRHRRDATAAGRGGARRRGLDDKGNAGQD